MSREARVTLRTFVVCAAIVAGTFALFSRSLGYGFINYDDPFFVVNNPHVQRGLSWEGVRWAFAVDRDFWHPLTWLSLMADRDMFGDDARGFRAVNVAWHALSALLVLAVVRRMTGRFWIAALCAVLFAWHPQRVESVVWITERKGVLSGFFALAAVWAWLRYGQACERHGRWGWAWYGVSLAAFLCGLMSKSVVVTLPLVLLLLDYWPLGRFGAAPAGGRAMGRLLAEKFPFLAASLAVGLFTVATQEAGGAFTLPLSLDQRVANALVSIVRYISVAVWPAGLAVPYPHPGHWPVAAFGAAGLAVAAGTVAAWLYRGERPEWLVGWGWFVAFLVPTLGLIQVGLHSMADRYSYLPSVGLLVAAAGLVQPALARWPARAARWGGVAGAVVVAGLCACTWRQQAVWRDADTLFTHAIAVTKDNYIAHTALALERLGDGRLPEAVDHAEQAIAIAPDAPLALDTFATMRMAQGRTDEAIDAYRRVIALQPRSISAKCDLGQILLQQGRLDEASALFTEVLATRPVNVPAHLGLADVALARARFDEALDYLTRAYDLAPRDARIAMRVAAVQLRVGRRDKAAATLVLASRLDPGNVELQRDVGDTLGQLGRFDEAATAYESAAHLVPTDAATHARLGYVYFLLKRPQDAIRSWETARTLDPSLTELDERIRQARSMMAAPR